MIETGSASPVGLTPHQWSVFGKKDGSLRLCIDYREQNKKEYLKWQLISRIQDILNNLNSKKWLTVLDQGKAYHQGFMTEKKSFVPITRVPFYVFSSNRIVQLKMALKRSEIYCNKGDFWEKNCALN